MSTQKPVERDWRIKRTVSSGARDVWIILDPDGAALRSKPSIRSEPRVRYWRSAESAHAALAAVRGDQA